MPRKSHISHKSRKSHRPHRTHRTHRTQRSKKSRRKSNSDKNHIPKTHRQKSKSSVKHISKRKSIGLDMSLTELQFIAKSNGIPFGGLNKHLLIQQILKYR